ncbi:ATP-binding cassette domain-containing protein [Escherichia coli]
MQENSPLLQLQNVGYLAGDAKILNNINFSLRAGEFKLITGPSGCGKTCAAKNSCFIDQPNQRNVTV